MSWEGSGHHRTPPKGGTPERKENYEPRRNDYQRRERRNSTEAIDREIARTQQRVMNALEQDAQVIRAARKLPMTGPLTKDQIDKARQNALDYMEQNELSRKVVAKGIGISVSVVSEALSGTYRGSVDEVIRKINAWVEQHARGKDSDRPQCFVSTTVARHMLRIIQDAIRTRSTAVIYGPAGVSKTTICLEAARTEIVGSVHVPCNVTCTSLASFSRLWCKCLGVAPGGSNADRFDRIVEVLKGSNRCQLIDDAHKLLPSRSRSVRSSETTSKSLEFIFDVHDAAGAPIVFFGTTEVAEAIGDERMHLGQLSSRVKIRYSITTAAMQDGRPLFTSDEVLKFAHSIGPQFRLTEGAAKHLSKISSTPGNGGLRRVKYILSMAFACMKSRRRAQKASDEIGPITIDDIQTAMGMLYEPKFAEHISTQAEELKIGVA